MKIGIGFRIHPLTPDNIHRDGLTFLSRSTAEPFVTHAMPHSTRGIVGSWGRDEERPIVYDLPLNYFVPKSRYPRYQSDT
jgi:hypothetical protein